MHVAGIAVAGDGAGPALLPMRAAYAALHDARISVSDLGAVIHVGHGSPAPVSAAVRDGLGARCGRTFDVDGGATGVIVALAVGGSLLDASGSVLITVAEPDGATASIVVTGGESPLATMEFDQARTGRTPPYVLRSASPIRGLLDARASGHLDVVLVAAGENTPVASVRCLLAKR